MGRCHRNIIDHRRGNEQYISQDQEKEVAMKFLLLVLGIRTVIEIIRNSKNKNMDKVDVKDRLVRHPAEFELR